MATISTVSTAATSAAATSASSTATKGIAQNFDQFLQLLTTQLRNQSPLDPLDSNQFTQQLVQFAGVEQQLNTNKTLEQLVASNKSTTLTNALGFVGARITADGTKSQLSGGQASWQLNAPRAGTATITITDKSGGTVYTAQQVLNAGDQTFAWDGRGTNGQTQPAGEYSIAISANDGSNQSMTVRTEMSGIVDSVDVTGESPILRIGAIAIDMSQVRSIRRN